MSELLEKIRSRGYWRVVIRPGNFVEKRVSNISTLYPLLQKISVQLRGWDFPHLDPRTPPITDVDWVGQESEWEAFVETWRIYQSGQFVDFAGMTEDWRDQSEWSPAPENWKPNLTLSAFDALFTVTEVFELAARLAQSEAGDDVMHIEVTPSHLAGRELRRDDAIHYLPLMPGKYKASIEKMPYQIDLPRMQLIAQARELALVPATELFKRFGWDPGLEVLRDMQAGLLHRGSRVVG